MKPLFTLLFLSVCFTICNAQIVDVFENEIYRYSTRVFEEVINKDYTPSEVEILQDKNEEKNEAWEKIETQLKALAIQQIENEVAFFKIHNKANKYLEQNNNWEDAYDYNRSSIKLNPEFQSIEIDLISVLNHVGVYRIQYKFKTIAVNQFYLADYGNGLLTPIAEPPSEAQQKVLRALTLPKLTTIYLLQTQKLSLENLDRIDASQQGKAKTPDFLYKINYSEARVYPYFSGVMVEFMANTTSSKIFDNQAFRILIKGEKLKDLLTVYPQFKPVFAKALQQPDTETYTALNAAKNFDLSRFRQAPKELRLFDNLQAMNEDKKIFSMQVDNYQIQDTLKRFMGTSKYFFNKNGQIIREERRGDRAKIRREKKYFYNENKQLTDILDPSDENSLERHYYQEGILTYIENIEIDEPYRRNSYDSEPKSPLMDVEMSQQHYAYNQNYRYTIHIDLVGEMNRNHRVQYRSINKGEYCTDYCCIITKKNGQVVAVKTHKMSTIEVRTNAQNQPLEAYFDHDRYRYFFSYDKQDRITAVHTSPQTRDAGATYYQYSRDDSKSLIINEKRGQLAFTYEYELAFW